MNIKTFILAFLLFVSFGCTASNEKKLTDSDIYIGIAREYIAVNKLDKALAEADNAIKAYEDNYSAWFLKADILGMQGQINEAKAIINKVAEKLPADKLFLKEHWMGVIFLYEGQREKAATNFENAVSMNGKYEENYPVLNRVYTELGDYDKAVTSARVWTSNFPMSDRAWETLGISQVMAKDYKGAKVALDKALELNPKSSMALNYLGRWADEQRKNEEAEKYYRASLEVNDANSYVNLSLGQLLMVNGRYDEALPFLEKSDTLLPGNEYTNYWLGRYYLNKKDYEKAFDKLKVSVAANADFPASRVALADVSIESGTHLKETIDSMHEGLAKRPELMKGFYFYLGKLYFANNELDKATEFADKAVALLDPSSTEEMADLHLLKGKIHSKRGDKEKARASFKDAVKISPASDAGREAQSLLKR